MLRREKQWPDLFLLEFLKNITGAYFAGLVEPDNLELGIEHNYERRNRIENGRGDTPLLCESGFRPLDSSVGIKEGEVGSFARSGRCVIHRETIKFPTGILSRLIEMLAVSRSVWQSPQLRPP